MGEIQPQAELQHKVHMSLTNQKSDPNACIFGA